MKDLQDKGEAWIQNCSRWSYICMYQWVWILYNHMLWEQDRSSLEAANEVAMVLEGLIVVTTTNEVLNTLKLGQLTRDDYGSPLSKTIDFLCLLQQLNKQWVVEVSHRHGNSLLLFPLTHFNCHVPFWYSSFCLTSFRFRRSKDKRQMTSNRTGN